MLYSYIIIFTGTHPIECKVRNLVSSLDLSDTFVFQQPVGNITLSSDYKNTTTGVVITLTISITAGSHLNFLIDPGPGHQMINLTYADLLPTVPLYSPYSETTYDFNSTISVTVGTCPSCYGASYSEWLGYVSHMTVQFAYQTPGDYVPSVTISNAISTKTQHLDHTIYIKIPLDDCIEIVEPQMVQKPPAVATVIFSIKDGKDCIGMVQVCYEHFAKGIFYCTNMNLDPMFDVAMQVPMDTLPLGDLDIEVILDNIVSHQLLKFNTSIVQEVANVSMTTFEDVIRVGDEALFLISVEQGTYETKVCNIKY